MEHRYKPRMHTLWKRWIGPFKVKVTVKVQLLVVVDKKQKQNQQQQQNNNKKLPYIQGLNYLMNVLTINVPQWLHCSQASFTEGLGKNIRFWGCLLKLLLCFMFLFCYDFLML